MEWNCYFFCLWKFQITNDRCSNTIWSHSFFTVSHSQLIHGQIIIVILVNDFITFHSGVLVTILYFNHWWATPQVCYDDDNKWLVISFCTFSECPNLPAVVHYRPRRNGRLSRPSCLTHGKQFTHKVVACKPHIGHWQGKVRRPKTNVLTAEPHSNGRRVKLLSRNSDYNMRSHCSWLATINTYCNSNINQDTMACSLEMKLSAELSPSRSRERLDVE